MWLFLVKEKYSTILRPHSQLSVTNHSWKNSICKSNNQQSTTCFQCHKSTDDMRKGKETLPKNKEMQSMMSIITILIILNIFV